MNSLSALKIAGITLATYLFVQAIVMPWGLLAGAALAMIVLS